ncbi:MAG: ATP-dependent helicase, partial [Bacilli bacterium]
EMKERVLKILKRDRFPGLITTFHSFCLRVLKEDINLLGYTKSFNIIDTDDQKSILKIINKKLNYDKDIFKVNALIAYISNIKNEVDIPYDPFLKGYYEEYYKEYQLHLKKYNSVDFDDLIILCNQLFNEFPQIKEKWRYRYNYIHVDEFQDTNAIQYSIVKHLGLDLHVFIVGDPDQTIYTWRGAKVDYIIDFEQDFKDTLVIKLEYNYRSMAHILAAANSIIVNNANRIDKELKATRNVEDTKVIHYVAQNTNQEADYVIEKINEIIAQNEGVNYSDFAILYRANYISRVFEQKLVAANIDYQIIGSVRFFERAEIKDLIAYLKVIYFEDDLSLLRIINNPKRSIGPKKLELINRVAAQSNLNLLTTIATKQGSLKLN